MKKQLKAIAILLFGILLTTASLPMDKIWSGDFWMLFCIAGILTGAAGLFMALSDKE